jgi:beta-glucosidase
MGLEWARVEPEPGVFDSEAIAHYVSEVKALRAVGITPLVTLHHFNNPGWLEDEGAWTNPDTVGFFVRYVHRMVHELGDDVSEWITINEPNVYATNGYAFGQWPPAHRSIPEAMKVMSLLAHGHIRAYQELHAIQPQAKVGIAQHLRPFDPASKVNPLDRASAATLAYLFQWGIFDAMALGRFHPPLTGSTSVSPGKYYDFTGVNYYSRSWVRGVSQGTRPDSSVNDLGWEIYPEGLSRLLAVVAEKYPGPIYVTENGTADATDAFRPRYIFDHLAALATCGVEVERFYHWCFVDNWEWAEGEQPRFGLVELNYETQERTIRPSGRFYADVITHRGVTDEAYARWVEPAAPSSTHSRPQPPPRRARRIGPPVL